MTPDEYREQFQADLATYNASSDRTRQKNEGQIGASDFVCRERMRRIIAKSPESDTTNSWSAVVGSALDKHLQAIRAQQRPGLIFGAEWPVTLDGRTFMVHPDEVDPSEPGLTDYKTKDGLAVSRAGLMGDSYRLQRHLQYLGGYKAGVLPAEGIVRNFVVDRSGKDPEHHVEQEPFSLEVVEQAASFMRDVHYALDNDEEASKDWARTMCRAYCPFFTACRGSEIVSEQIDDPLLTAMVDAYADAKALAKDAEQLMSELREPLDGVQGHTDRNEIHWQVSNGAKRSTRSLHVNPRKEAAA